MTITTRKAGLSGLAILGASAIVLSGCAAAPEDTPSESAAPDFLACMVSDSGGFDDHSFNELGLQGLQDAASELGIEEKHVESSSEDDFAPNIESLLGEGCNMIVTVGFLLSAATITAAQANPDVEFAIVDDSLDGDFDGVNDTENGKPILFNTAEAAFLAGYAAAATSKTGVVGTFGGIQINPVTIFMDGFVDGVAYYNEQNGTSVKAIGWDKASQTGSFTGGFAAGVEAKTAAQNLLDQGADVILPVGGPIYQSAAEAIREKGGDIALIGVDADVYNTDESVKDLLLTSVMKGVDAGVHDTVVAAAEGKFDIAPYVGTLENGGVGIAPFHDWESKVPADLSATLDDLKAQIISGDLKVTSPATPQ
ncbi:BMP family lipoprotein [Protaetiibacter mangrovi]|uniref:BMP family ABC transporter substrate-binding protein n=1 Tax=Protaetiibacter mangrovi TaxID=2970926 RepID=A0ABT1ZFP8_9MICO|nr:BMP family ABC transporter substrate-binding protein [Protaetiibacter mangrovi]MCS0499522.1 BMP family ABC transporter substrate-binding protein [Protaetiibacter mangrovi]TPX03342.1 BMP family ABC transporter substrate-binding protein [Schumannella luteola]